MLLLWMACTGVAPDPMATGDSAPVDTATCAAEEVWDGAACVPAACGTGPFGDVVADAYVDPGAAPGGDGSLGAPFTSLAEALEGDAPTLALAAGDHPGPFSLNPRDGRSLLGRCADLVRLVGTDDAPVLSLSRGPFTLQGLSLVATEGYGIQIESGAVVEASDVSVSGAHGVGVAVYDASLSATRLAVEGSDALGRTDDGFGVEVAYADVTLVDPTLRGNRVAQVLVYGTGVLTLDGGRIEDGVAGNDGFAAALRVERGGTATVTGTTLRGATRFGVMVDGSATEVHLEDLVVEDLLDEAGEAVGVLAGGGATVEMTGGTLSGLDGAGIGATDGSTVTVAGVTVEAATHPNSTGLLVTTDASLTCTDCRVSGQQVAGVWSESGGRLRLVGGEIVDTGPGVGAAGLQAVSGGTVEATGLSVRGGAGPGARADDGGILLIDGCTFEDNVGAGVAALAGSRATVSDSTILGTTVGGKVTYAFGVVAFDSTLDLRDTTITDVTGSGVAAEGGSTRLEGVTISGGDAALDGFGGYGMEFVGGSAEVVDSRVSALFGLGLLASEGAVVEVSGSTVEEVVANPSMRSGPGVAAQLGGVIRLTDSAVWSCAPGLLTLDGGRIEASGATLSANGFAGVVVAGGAISLVDSTIVDGVVDPSTGGGVGVYLSDETTVGEVSLERVTVGAHPLAAIWDSGAGRLTVVDSDLSGGPGLERAGQVLQGNALFARGAGAGGIAVSGTRLGGSAVAVLLHDATAGLSGNTWEDNTLDLVVQACGEAPLPDTDGAATVALCPAEDRLYAPLTWDFVLPEVDVVLE